MQKAIDRWAESLCPGRDDGLFRAAIGQSGFGGVLARYPGGANATGAFQSLYDLLVTNTSCARTVGSPASLDCLRALPLGELDAALNGTAASPWPPMLDHDFIADYPANQLEEGRFARVPILIGANADEGAAFGSGKGPGGAGVSTDADLRYALDGIIGPDAPQWTGKPADRLKDELLAVYPDVQAVGIPSLEKFPAISPGDAIATAQGLGLQYRRAGAVFGDL